MGRGMRAGKKPKAPGAGGNMKNQLKQVQAMQKQMEEAQAALEEKEITTTAGGGVVEAVINGKKEIVSLNIDKDVIDPDDPETLQDLIIAAVNEGLRQVDDMAEAEMNKITGGFNFGF